METPVLLIVYKRPETTRKVLNALLKVKLKKIFVAFEIPDPRFPGEAEKCEQVKNLFQEIPPDCEKHFLIHDEHLSCSNSISTAINWFFSHVDEGIILEDDCVPSMSFLNFCDQLLPRFRTNTRVMMISGNNQLGRWQKENCSYHFTKTGGCWGWATWKRAWQKFDPNMSEWKEAKEKNLLSEIFRSPDQAVYWEKLFNQNPAWDYIWTFYKLYHRGLTIVPRTNLIENIGFGNDATHTKDKIHFPKRMLEIKELKSRNLVHPDLVEADRQYDDEVFKKILMYKSSDNIFRRLKSSIKYRISG